MNYTITLGWWLVPALLTLAAWVPTLRYKSQHGSYLPDFGVVFLGAGSLIATLAVWMVYFAIGWALA